ncbi:MerR family transcriptional regulator [Nocardia sp. NPDC127579]|uniref:MerR family transcriptional regulator n=1 Tax=Nocardia sp. NPDC127579 TaxID=3345402 RepID=UPI0036342839
MLIGEVARRSGVSARMLRHYDSLGLVRPTGRTVGGYREYSDADIRRILYVEGLRTLGLSLSQIGSALDDSEFAPADLIADLVRRTEERLRREQELLDRLRAVDAAEPGSWDDVLRIVELLRGLDSPDAARRMRTALAPADIGSMPADLLAEAVLTEPDLNVAGALRWALARSGGEGVAIVVAALADADPAIRRRAILTLIELPGAAATSALVDALRHADSAIRTQAALTLGNRGLAQSIPALVATVVTGPNDVEAGELLGRFARDPAHADHILDALRAELGAPTATRAIRIRLTQALAELPIALARIGLHALADDHDQSVARIAAALSTMLDQRREDNG